MQKRKQQKKKAKRIRGAKKIKTGRTHKAQKQLAS
jgi:hypothetical protein